MNPISFSYIAAPNAPDLVPPALEDFERRTRIAVRATRLGIHGRGFDISEIGTTWLGDFMGMNAGRSFRLIWLWGMVEERLTETLGKVWLDVLKNPADDSEPAVRSHLDALANRLNLVLGGG